MKYKAIPIITVIVIPMRSVGFANIKTDDIIKDAIIDLIMKSTFISNNNIFLETL
jgi:hypothetical protein